MCVLKVGASVVAWVFYRFVYRWLAKVPTFVYCEVVVRIPPCRYCMPRVLYILTENSCCFSLVEKNCFPMRF